MAGNRSDATEPLKVLVEAPTLEIDSYEAFRVKVWCSVELDAICDAWILSPNILSVVEEDLRLVPLLSDIAHSAQRLFDGANPFGDNIGESTGVSCIINF